MAVNRFMKPAEQPLMNTYVRLPFEEMSLAYNQVQKEHDAGEKLAGSLDDEILKVRSSTPLHNTVLTQTRKDLDAKLNALIEKHGGRYADMVPELTAIKADIDRSFNDGNLYAIKETTRALEEDLNPAIATAKEAGEYSDLYNPYFAGQRDWTDFYNHGLKLVEGSDGTKSWVPDQNSTAGWTMKNGKPVLEAFTYSGIHKPSDQLKIANEQTYDKIKADFVKGLEEDPITGAKAMESYRGITLSKIYKAAMDDIDYYPANMQKEIEFEVSMMDDKDQLGAATHAINMLFGNPAAGSDAAEAKQKALDAITGDSNEAKAARFNMAKVDYVGYMGEKYVFDERINELTFDQSVANKNRYPIEKSDWVPKIGDQSGFIAGTIRNVNGEPIDNVGSYIDIVNTNGDTYKNLISEYETTKDNYSLDDPYHKEWADKINLAKYHYESSAMSLFNLTQGAAKQLNVQQTNEGIRWQNEAGQWRYVDMMKGDGTVNPEWETHGWSAIQFDDSGNIASVEEVNALAGTPNDNIYEYMDRAKSLFENVYSLGGGAGSELMKRIDANVDNSEYFKGRITSAQTLTSTGSKRADAEIAESLPGILGDEDQNFLRSDGKQTNWKKLVEENIITQETVDKFLDGEFSESVVWLTNPNPDGSYYGALTLPKGSGSTDDGTVDLFFTAPSKVRDVWRNQMETTRPIGDGTGRTEFITIPRTEEQKMLWDANELAQIDFSRAATTPGNVAMSSAEDGENNPLGYYYFNQLPNGNPIQNEAYVFQPRAGLIMDIDADGGYIYTTGNELFNADTDASKVGMLITLNDPQYSGAKAYWANRSQADPNPIAREGIPVTETSEARGVDITGQNFSTTLRPGQLMLPESRMTQGRAENANNASTVKGQAMNHAFVGLNDTFADIVSITTSKFNTEWDLKVNNALGQNMSGEIITYADGSTTDFFTALGAGDIQVIPMNSIDGNFSLPVISGARSYEQQKAMYDEWIENDKPYPPIANPDAGGFHVFGQAIDLSSNMADYDWIIADRSGKKIQTIGNNSVGNHTRKNGFDQTGVAVRGIRISELVNKNGNLVMPNYNKTVLTSLFNQLSNTPQSIKDEQKREGPWKEATVLPNIKQFDQEWWHWSLGELTGASSGFVYPSWAK